ncbi:MAG: PhoU domain-containing protein [Candidatus Ancaeobacter aquaticus]|nr:PhoU domain-containing protein [Candidatus Ancaeobacter aquaticus]
MFKSIINFWKGKDFMSKVLGDFETMLNDSETMFVLVNKRLTGEDTETDIKDTIYKMDRTINKLQRDIRKRVIEHFALQPTVDMPTSLILMSVVKDAERLGDYAKNLYEVTELLQRPYDKGYYEDLFDSMDKKLLDIFQKTKKCFIDSDEKLAQEIVDIERGIVKACDTGIEKLAKSKLETNQAVCSTLTLRYYKRICAHLGNIASSVYMPLTDLDHFDEKTRQGEVQ